MKSLAIAANTFREARRHRVFYVIFFFALIVILNSVLFTNLAVASQDRILRDVGTAAIDFFGVLLAIFLGVGMVSREVDRRTVYTVVTKPIRRADFILGKFFGLNAVLGVTLGVMFVCFVAVLAVTPAFEPPNYATLTWHLVLRLVQLALLVSFAIFMSTFAATPMATFVTIGIFLIGHLSSDLKYWGQKSENPVVDALSTGIYYLFPNLGRFSISEQIAYNMPVDTARALTTILYGVLYTAVFLVAAVMVFNRRDFK